MIQVPSPESRVSADLYREVRAWLLANDPDASKVVEWAEREIAFPASPEEMAGDVIWIILCAGRSAQAARTLEKRVWAQIRAGRPVVEVFGYRAKADAIERAWAERVKDYAALRAIGPDKPEQIVEWAGNLPFVGDDTKFQLAKNFGADVCKPDIWLCRLAGIADKPRRNIRLRFAACMALCRPLAAAAGERVATVDSVLWLACNKRVLQVGAQGGPVHFRPQPITARSMLIAAA